MSDALRRLDTGAGPPPLQARAARYVADVPAGGDAADTLASAGALALARAVDHPGDRSIALDLLASDALVTLALEAQADANPAGLAAFAERLRAVAFPDATTRP